MRMGPPRTARVLQKTSNGAVTTAVTRSRQICCRMRGRLSHALDFNRNCKDFMIVAVKIKITSRFVAFFPLHNFVVDIGVVHVPIP